MSTIEPTEPLDPPLVKRAIAEAIGTFILVFLGCGAAIALTGAVPGGASALQFTGIALAFGLGIAGAIYAVGHVSGGHLNPAVSVALTVIGRFRAADLPAYIGAQVVGAVLAALALKGVFPDADGLGNNFVQDGVSNGSALLAEAVLSAVFLFVIVSVATDRRVTPGFAALAIGLTLAAIHLVGIPLTGTSVNPARTFGPDLISGDHWGDIWIFLVGPFVGATAGALAYQTVRPDRD
ncbi:MIP/aquaporin family protein [Patulibacter defluvii]|uniref:MIP/aquaporin family protein n=1 Tax=Patulibacter defluvii TaxID=3095358 RepID=UPI002A748267|nr:MIP/aquaporin family protein [Patulibacter sp. DM4]